MATRNDRDNDGHPRRDGRNNPYGIGSFEEQQWSSQNDRERSPSRDIQGRFSRDNDRRNSMFGRSRDPDEDRFREEDRYRRRGEEDRNWFDRARDNVRGWFRHDDDDDRRRYRDEGRGDHQVFGGRGLQSYDDPRRIRDDEQRRFGRDERFDADDERWFDHRVHDDDRFDDYHRSDESIEQRMRDDDRDRELGRYDYSRQRGWQGRDDSERTSLGGVRDTGQHGDIRVRAQMRAADRERYGNMPEDRYYRDGLYRDDRGGRDERHRFADTDDNPRHAWRGWSGRSDRHHDDHRRAPLARDERSRLAPQSEDDRYGHPSTRGNRIDYNQQWVSNTERGDDDRASRTRGRDEDQDRSFVPRDEYGRRRR